MPSGCGEQQISQYGKMLTLFKYFSKTGKLSLEKMQIAKRKLTKNYQELMRYKTSDNGFKVSINSDVSV